MSRGNRSRQSGERTAEERNRAREERARRRAERAANGGSSTLAREAPAASFDAPAASEPSPPDGALGAPVPPGASGAAPVPPAAPPPASSGPPPPQPPAVPVPAPEPPQVPLPEPANEAALPPPAPAGAPGAPGALRTRPKSRHSLGGRLAAVAAIAAALAVVVVVVRALSGAGGSKPAASAVAKVVIPEGSTRIQIARIAAAEGLAGSYRAAAKRSPLLNPVHYGAPRATPDLEGFLFPATYEFGHGAPVGKLVDEQLAAFKEHFGPEEMGRARTLHVTPYELLTIASMIEREARVPGDRAKIAAVIYNRLHRGMPLGIDATIYYAIETRTGVATYTGELSEAQLHIDSAYNTRTHAGLPPTPISNPGVPSIQAAAHPDHVPYLYYVLAADGCGEHVFSRTLAAFEANASAYDAAVKKNGGHPPTCKKK